MGTQLEYFLVKAKKKIMKVSIMQPTCLPWVGYFKMIIESDLFIFLDDVQFERRSFQSRNKILLNNQEKLISIPVFKTNRFIF